MAAGQAASGTTPPSGGTGDPADAAPGKPQVFRSVGGLIMWWGWLLFAVANLIDLAVQGRDHLSAVVAAALVLGTGIGYVAGWQPRVIVRSDGVLIRNPLREHQIPWSAITRADIADVLRIHLAPGAAGGKKAITAWAIHYSRRRQLTAETRARRSAVRASRGGGNFGGFDSRSLPYGRGRQGGGYGYGLSLSAPASANPNSIGSAEAEAEKLARILNDRAEAAGIERASTATGTEPAVEPVRSSWSMREIAVIAIPALILLIVALA
jgi:Bacterial PH domain